MRKCFRGVALAAIALALSCVSCVETKNDATVNPDGTAKVTIDALLALPMTGQDAEKLDPAKQVKDCANDFLARAKGVDAWKDVSFELSKDGRVHLKAIAYVADLSHFELEMVPPVQWSVDSNGVGTLEIKKDKPAASAPAPKAMTDEEVQKRVQQERMQYQQSKPMFQAIFSNLRIDATYELPGAITESNIFTKTGPSQANVVFEGKKLADAMDKMMADDKALAESIRTGKKIDNDEEMMFQMMFGKKGPATVKVAGATQAQFDYKKEMTAAKDAQAEMLKKLDIDLKAKPVFGPDSSPGND